MPVLPTWSSPGNMYTQPPSASLGTGSISTGNTLYPTAANKKKLGMVPNQLQPGNTFAIQGLTAQGANPVSGMSMSIGGSGGMTSPISGQNPVSGGIPQTGGAGGMNTTLAVGEEGGGTPTGSPQGGNVFPGRPTNGTGATPGTGQGGSGYVFPGAPMGSGRTVGGGSGSYQPGAGGGVNTTLAIGEEGGGAGSQKPNAGGTSGGNTTLAIGEEGGGASGTPGASTGSGGGSTGPSTLAMGEEGGGSKTGSGIPGIGFDGGATGAGGLGRPTSGSQSPSTGAYAGQQPLGAANALPNPNRYQGGDNDVPETRNGVTKTKGQWRYEEDLFSFNRAWNNSNNAGRDRLLGGEPTSDAFGTVGRIGNDSIGTNWQKKKFAGQGNVGNASNPESGMTTTGPQDMGPAIGTLPSGSIPAGTWKLPDWMTGGGYYAGTDYSNSPLPPDQQSSGRPYTVNPAPGKPGIPTNEITTTGPQNMGYGFTGSSAQSSGGSGIGFDGNIAAEPGGGMSSGSVNPYTGQGAQGSVYYPQTGQGAAWYYPSIMSPFGGLVDDGQSKYNFIQELLNKMGGYGGLEGFNNSTGGSSSGSSGGASAGSAGGSLGAMLKKAYDDAFAANKAREDEIRGRYQGMIGELLPWLKDQRAGIEAGYNDRLNTGMGMLDQYGQQMEKDITDEGKKLGASTDQSMINRGLYNTTVRDNMQQGVYRRTQDALGAARDNIARTKSGMYAGLSGDALGAQMSLLGMEYGANSDLPQRYTDFIERIQDQYPDMAKYLQLGLQAGQGMGGMPGSGGVMMGYPIMSGGTSPGYETGGNGTGDTGGGYTYPGTGPGVNAESGGGGTGGGTTPPSGGGGGGAPTTAGIASEAGGGGYPGGVSGGTGGATTTVYNEEGGGLIGYPGYGYPGGSMPPTSGTGSTPGSGSGSGSGSTTTPSSEEGGGSGGGTPSPGGAMGNGLSLSGYPADQRNAIDGYAKDTYGLTYEALPDDLKFEVLMQAAQLGLLGGNTQSIADIWKQKLGQ